MIASSRPTQRTDVPDPERATLIVENSFVAIADGAVIGVASHILHPDRVAETASLAVAPDWLSSLVGEQLQNARLAELRSRGVEFVRTESDRGETVDWYVRKYGYRIVGTARKKHSFGLANVDHWTVLELDLRSWRPATP
jgi:predicted N-acetyltransferase YhbS